MLRKISSAIDSVSTFLAARKGLLPFSGILLIIINMVLHFFPENFYTRTEILLHIGLILSILGLMLGKAL